MNERLKRLDSFNLFVSILQNMPIGYLVLLEDKIKICNPQMTKWLGFYDYTDVLGKSILDFVPNQNYLHDQIKKYLKYINKGYIQKGSLQKIHIQDKNGKGFDVNITYERVKYGTDYAVGILIDKAVM